MDKNVIQFLDSFGLPLGTWIALIIGIVSFVLCAITAVKKFKKKYDANLQKKLKAAEENRKFHESVNNITSTVNDIQNHMASFMEYQENVNNKLNDLWDAIKDSRNESEDADTEIEHRIEDYMSVMDNINQRISAMDEKTSLLIESDKEGIKSYIVDKYYRALSDGYIELHVLETLELRYDKYLQENGNTYVGKLMEGLRKMPNEPPNND